MSRIWTPRRRIWTPPSRQGGFVCLPGGLGAGKPGGGGGSAPYEVLKSLRLRASATAYLSRTPSVTGNRKIWTWSGWVKRGLLTGTHALFSCNNNSTGYFELFFNAGLICYDGFFNSTRSLRHSTTTFLDSSAHLHVLCSVDTSRAAAEDRVSIYVNNVRVSTPTVIGSTAWPGLNSDTGLNISGVTHAIGRRPFDNDHHADLHISEVRFIDGQALDPTSFGETDSNGVWVPKAYSGTYGTNGFYLPFSDGTSLSTLTADASGNGNNWTANNISLTAGVNYDWMDDTPTNNHATLNNLVAGAANITKANLASGTTAVRGTFNALAISSYWEVTAGGSNVTAGVINDAGTTNTVTVTANKTFAFRLSTAGALDYRNVTDSGAWTSITTGLSGNQFPYGTTAAADWNFGQRPFSGTVPDGYAKLCAANLTNTTITTSGSFTGNASADGPVIFTNGVPTAMTINGNAVTFGTHADKLASGFKVRSSSASYNASGTNTYSITATGAAFKYARAQVNP